MEKVKVFSALADVEIMSTFGRGSMRRGSQSYFYLLLHSIGEWSH
jgi:hypothetical protein